jgi:cell wall-associated NlpC family hydrolase
MSAICLAKPAPGWSAPYIGAAYRWGGADPATGWDCWGLHVYCLAHHYGVELPALAHLRAPGLAEDRAARHAVQARALATNAGGQIRSRRLETPVPGAAILFNIQGRPLHVGHYLGNGRFLHVDRKTPTCIEDLSSPQWKKRIEGFYVPA